MAEERPKLIIHFVTVAYSPGLKHGEAKIGGQKRIAYQQGYREAVGKIKNIAVFCTLNKHRDDGVHVDYKCLDCGQEWGEEEKTPYCKNAAIRLPDLLTLLNKEE